jgi:hypothetical protein
VGEHDLLLTLLRLLFYSPPLVIVVGLWMLHRHDKAEEARLKAQEFAEALDPQSNPLLTGEIGRYEGMRFTDLT